MVKLKHSGKKSRSSISGFSLIEVIIGILLTGIIASVIAVTVNMSFRVFDRIQSRKAIVLNGSVASNKFARDLRLYWHFEALQYADSNRIRFLNCQDVTIDYELANNLLYRMVIGAGPQQVLTQGVNIATSSFNYYNRDNQQLTNTPLSQTDRENVWRMEMVLDLMDGSEMIHFISEAAPQNLKLVAISE